MFANRGKFNYNKKREVYMSKIKSYIMDVESFVDNYFDYETETFKTDKQQILLEVRGEFKDTLAVEIARDYIDDQDAHNDIFVDVNNTGGKW